MICLNKALRYSWLSFLFYYATTLAQIVNIESKRFQKDTNGFAGRADVFFSMNQNRFMVVSLGGNMHTQYRCNRHRWLHVVDYAYIKAGNNPFVNNGYIHLRYNYKIRTGFYWELFGQIQYNLAILLDRRELTGAGFRFHVWKKESLGIFSGIGWFYEQQWMNQKYEKYFFHRVNMYLSFFYRKNFLELTGTFYYQPVWNNFIIYRNSADIQMELFPRRKISFVITFSGFYDELLPAGIPHFIFVTRNTLRISLQ